MSIELDRPGPLVALISPGSRGAPGNGRRTPRDWIVDVLFVVVGVLGSLPAWNTPDGSRIHPPLALNVTIGILGALLLLVRRKWPLALALGLTVVSVVLPAAGGGSALALFSLAVHRRPLISGLGCAAAILSAALQIWIYPPAPTVPYVYWLVVGAASLLCIASVAWGIVVRTRRQLMASLTERARRAEEDQEQRVELGRRRERERIAREMHDALGHRLSLLTVHAGALEFRPEMPPAELAVAAGVIRSNARECLEDLREIVGVLRTSDSSTPGGQRPQPGLGDLEALVEESRAAGMTVRFTPLAAPPESIPLTIGRHGYRIVQEGLTNARKHAPGEPVTVVLSGAAGNGLSIEVRNPMSGNPPATGSRVGLVGLAERAKLAGGTLEHGPTSTGSFRLHAWLPWPE
ncbi:sensor histidine kinase [Kribbella sp. CA-293567]|uniref:sensor histidine kinase n=1 Tax=Kribbella sp. CA-293567 TaxID=3002436 RepID=UPI0022DE83D6|nr:histidine kinase [Kribbella sp. CA-293567]WBQ02112.1 histidine kinase [Kribbella sp. CA-293567]